MRLLIVSFFFFFCLPAVAAEPVIRVGVDAPYPPFAYNDPETGELTGFDVEMAKAFCKTMKRECRIEVVPFDKIIPAVIAGDIDIGVAGMSKTPEREEKVLFSDKYFRSSSIFIVLAENLTETEFPEAAKGKKIGVQSGTIQETYIQENYGDSVEMLKFTGFDDIVKALHAKELDFALIDGLPGYYFLTTPEGEGLERAGEPLRLGTGSCAVLRKGTENLRDALNNAITEMRSSGEYDRINRKYFEFNVY